MAIIIDAKDARRIPKAFQTALISTINKALSKARVAASKEVRRIYAIKAGDLKKSVRITKARKGRIKASHTVAGKRLKLSYFGPRQTKKGVSIRIKKSEGRKIILSSFKAVMTSGHEGVYQRKTSKRLPIKELTTLDLPTMYDIRAEKTFDKAISDNMNKIFDHELEYRLSKI